MANLNKVQLIGHLGRDPEMKYMPSGDAIANLSVATTMKWTDKETGEKKEETEWHRVVLKKQQAQFVDSYAKKGSLVYIEGRLRTRKWQDKEGQDRYSTEVIGSSVQLLSGGHSSEEAPRKEAPKPSDAKREEERASASTPSGAKKGSFDDMEDDIPF